ncbi:hypothetical protein ACWER9_06580 [Micromonospora sp. NPDC003944]
MPWVRFDDQFPLHRKVGGLSDAAYRVASEAIFWCSRNLTDGVIRAHEVNQIRPRAERSVGEIVGRDLWHHAADVEACPNCSARLAEAGRPIPPDGYVVHDYLGFQPSRAKVMQEREAKAERQQRWRDKKRGGPRDASVDTSRDASTPRPVDAPVDASVDAPVDPAPSPTPSPPRRKRGRESPGDPPPAARRQAPGGGSTPPATNAPSSTDPDNPDWRTRPAFGAPREPDEAERTRSRAAAVRAAIPPRRRTQPTGPTALERLTQLADSIDPNPTQEAS